MRYTIELDEETGDALQEYASAEWRSCEMQIAKIVSEWVKDRDGDSAPTARVLPFRESWATGSGTITTPPPTAPHLATVAAAERQATIASQRPAPAATAKPKKAAKLTPAGQRTRAAVLAAISTNFMATPADLATIIGKSQATVRSHLRALLQDNAIEAWLNGDGHRHYCLRADQRLATLRAEDGWYRSPNAHTHTRVSGHTRRIKPRVKRDANHQTGAGFRQMGQPRNAPITN